ncbi:K02A2.6-like [Cordylochernes scorpioides]|uniref:K02A2.6-like n=1 Tax=Cordylochernes scorpioides TaxID=51811 RepID=A0ABY6LQG5_9ARAC|nr:K02A2.6-like [Cordylochernes scorpioides]
MGKSTRRPTTWRTDPAIFFFKLPRSECNNSNNGIIQLKIGTLQLENCLAGSSYFSTMDLRSGYWQIEVDEKDREKTAFITPNGL